MRRAITPRSIARLSGTRRHACCCHVPEAAKPQRPELWEQRAPREECREHAFEFDAARTRFGRGVLAEAGTTARAMGLRRVAVITDRVVASQPFYDAALRSFQEAGVDAVEYAGSQVEPTDQSFLAAARWAQDVLAAVANKPARLKKLKLSSFP